MHKFKERTYKLPMFKLRQLQLRRSYYPANDRLHTSEVRKSQLSKSTTQSLLRTRIWAS